MLYVVRSWQTPNYRSPSERSNQVLAICHEGRNECTEAAREIKYEAVLFASYGFALISFCNLWSTTPAFAGSQRLRRLSRHQRYERVAFPRRWLRVARVAVSKLHSGGDGSASDPIASASDRSDDGRVSSRQKSMKCLMEWTRH